MSDLGYPSGPDDYRSAFFAADYRTLGDNPYTNWLDPGDYYYRVRHGCNADQSQATYEEIQTARNQWDSISRCQRWRVRLHHEALCKWPHDTVEKIFVYYHTGIPASKKQQIISCLDPGEFEYLGDTFSEASATLEDHQAGLTEHFFPGNGANIPPGVMSPVVQGWEADAE